MPASLRALLHPVRSPAHSPYVAKAKAGSAEQQFPRHANRHCLHACVHYVHMCVTIRRANDDSGGIGAKEVVNLRRRETWNDMLLSCQPLTIVARHPAP